MAGMGRGSSDDDRRRSKHCLLLYIVLFLPIPAIFTYIIFSTKKSYEITLEFFAYKEKLIREQIVLEACDSSRCTVTLLIHAQVLGKGKGTPFLKNGVHCIGYELVKEGSEHSDWQGFD